MQKYLQTFITISIADVKGKELLETGASKLVSITVFNRGQILCSESDVLHDSTFIQSYVEKNLVKMGEIIPKNGNEIPYLVHTFTARELDDLFHEMRYSELFDKIKKYGVVDLGSLLFVAGYSDFNDYTHKHQNELQLTSSKSQNMGAVYMALMSDTQIL